MTISSDMWEIIQKLVHIKPRNPFPGKVAVIWSKAQPEIEAIVKKERLQPIQILNAKQGKALSAGASSDGLFWWRPDGGWPLPHFHLGDKLYSISDVMWSSFSAQALNKIGASLQNAKLQSKVTFDQFMDITESAAKF